MPDTCENCGNGIHISIFKGGPHCSDDCRKALEAKASEPKTYRCKNCGSVIYPRSSMGDDYWVHDKKNPESFAFFRCWPGNPSSPIAEPEKP